MIEILLIKSSSIQIVEAIARTIYINGTIVERINDREYPIAYRIEMNNKYKVVARDIKE